MINVYSYFLYASLYTIAFWNLYIFCKMYYLFYFVCLVDFFVFVNWNRNYGQFSILFMLVSIKNMLKCQEIWSKRFVSKWTKMSSDTEAVSQVASSQVKSKNRTKSKTCLQKYSLHCTTWENFKFSSNFFICNTKIWYCK